MANVDVDQILKEWNRTAATMRKPTLVEGCDVIETLCVEVKQLRNALASEQKRQEAEEQKYRTMLIEVQNVVTGYFRDYEKKAEIKKGGNS